MKLNFSLSKWSPNGLFARSLLIIVMPIAIMQILVTYLFFDLHWGQVSKTLSQSSVADISYITNSYLKNPSAKNLETLKNDAQVDLRLSVALQIDGNLPQRARHSTIPAYDRTLHKALSQQIKYPFWFDTTRYPDYVDIRVKVPKGVLRFLAYRDRVFASTGGIFLLWLIGATSILAIVSVLFIRNQIRPMERLADAADKFGKGEKIDLKPAGSREIRRATQAFLDMRARIMRHLEQRTNILAGVSHDLRTPLTRLKLELELLPQSQNLKAAKDDIKQMEDMLEEYLSFAKGEWAGNNEEINLNELAQNIYNDFARNHKNIKCNISNIQMKTIGKTQSLTRLLSNLIDNALCYGKAVLISTRYDEKRVYIDIDDDGPGLTPEQYEAALNPFTRLDGARNQNKKGVGLGLSIARDIARAHGGELILSKSKMGGLRATLRLPKA